MRWGILPLIGAMIWSQAFSQATYDTLPYSPVHYKQRIDRFAKEPVVTGKILFLGSSQTERGNWRRLLKDSSVVNRGISGDNTFGVLRRLDDIMRRKPSKIFLLIGVDDLSKNIPTEVVLENIFAIISKLRAGSPKPSIFVQSLLPVNPALKNFPPSFAKQDQIIELNGLLKKYSDVLKFTFIDIHSEFVDKQNVFDPKLTIDGLYLNSSGYAHWIDFLRKNNYVP